jgi:Uma2 family endonuclease
MSGAPAEKSRRATYADLQAVPDHRVAEIIDGVLHVSPRPASPHARASSLLTIDLGSAFYRGRGGPGGWVILDEPELHLGPEPDVLVPDLAGWRRERMPEVPDVPAFTLAPDWVCEVLSPSTEAMDRAEKMPVYARECVVHVWLVDPVLQTLEVLRLEGAGWLLLATYHGDRAVRAEPFHAIELDLAGIWAR